MRPARHCRQTADVLDETRSIHYAWLEISGLLLGQLVEVLRDADTTRVVFALDWPFYHPVLPLAKVLIATHGQPELRARILHDNAARLLEMKRA